MTLVVARASSHQISICSDSKKTSASEILKGLEGITLLKSIILHPDLCICYAGSVAKAQRAINSFAVQPDQSFNIEVLLDKLYKMHIESEYDTDFIVAILKPQAMLYEIKSGELKRDIAVSWIGNQEAFSDYQKYYHTLPSANMDAIPVEIRETLEIRSTMFSAFDEVLKSEIFDDVSGFAINVLTEKEGFTYAERAMIFGIKQSIPPHTTARLKFGTAAEGGYGYSLMTPKQAGIGAIGLHFFQGRFGALIYPLKSEKAIIFRNANADEFRQLVRNTYGFEIDGPRIN